MAKKSYQLDGAHSSFTVSVGPSGKQVQLTPDNDIYETSDPVEQDELDAQVARAGSGLKKAGK